MQETGLGNEGGPRAPRLPLAGAERTEFLRIIREGIAARPKLPASKGRKKGAGPKKPAAPAGASRLPFVATSARPNVVVIVADDMGYGDLGRFNEGWSSTPQPRPCSRRGATASPSTTPGSPVCAPARAALLTGRYPHRTGPSTRLHGRGLDRIALAELTIADCFRAAGYPTGLVGKWHNGALDARFTPTRGASRSSPASPAAALGLLGLALDCNGTLEARRRRLPHRRVNRARLAFVRRHRARNRSSSSSPTTRRTSRCRRRPELVERYVEAGETLGAALDLRDGRGDGHRDRPDRRDASRPARPGRTTRSSCSRATTGPISARSRGSASTASTTAGAAPSTTSTRAGSGCRRSSAGRSGLEGEGSCSEMLHFTELAADTRCAAANQRAGTTISARRGRHRPVLAGDPAK